MVRLLAGDIGGTKSWLALLESDHRGELQLRFEQRYPSRDFDSVSALLRQFFRDSAEPARPPDRALLALPGPVTSGRCQLTNLDWQVDSRELQSELAIPQLTLVNDFAAAAAGIATLQERDQRPLNQAAVTPQGIRVVTGAGTGLGLAWLQWQQDHYHTHATEGGHCDFAPANPRQLELLHFLFEHHHHVSYERLLSGWGLETLYHFYVERRGRMPQGPRRMVEAAAVSTLAQQGDESASAALELFIEIYGGWVGNLALLYRPTGGLFIAGGIAAKITAWMQSETFLRACYNKGGMSGLVEQTPIILVTNERLGLQGAIALAAGH